VEVVPADCDDIEAVRKLTDRCVMAVRGKYRGRSGYIVGAGKGCYIVSIDGEECQIKGSHLELQHEDYGSSEEQEADVIQVPASGEDDDQEADGDSAPVRRSVRLDPDFDEITGTRLVQKRVIIREGKLSGQIGKVASSGHGFYCVRARGMQVKLRRREFEVIEDDPSENVLSREAIADGSAPVELKGVAAGSDNALVGTTCMVKLNGPHKGQVGKVDAYTYGIYSLTMLDGSEKDPVKALFLAEDLEQVHDYKVTPKRDQAREKSNQEDDTEKDNPIAPLIGKRAAVKGGKFDGRVGEITGGDANHYTLSFGRGEDSQRLKSKEVLVLEPGVGSLPAGLESKPDPPEVDMDAVAEGQAKLLVGDHAGKVGRVVSTDESGGWTQVEVESNMVWSRTADIETSKSAKLSAVQQPEAISDWAGKTVKVRSGLAAGKTGSVTTVLESSKILVITSAGSEFRVPVAAAEVTEEQTNERPFGPSCNWASINDDAVVGSRWRGRAGRVLGQGHDWVYLQIGNDEVRVKSGDLMGLDALPLSEDEDSRKRSRDDDDSDASTRPVSREQRPKRLKPDKKEEEDEELVGMNMANAADGTLVKIRVGEHAGKTGVILWSGHGWINVKVGNEEVRIRSRDIAPAERESSKQSEPEASPVPKSKVSIRVGKHKGQTGRVLSSGHGWLWVQLGKEEVRVRRKDVTTLPG